MEDELTVTVRFRRVLLFVVSLFLINFFEMGVLKSFSVLVSDLVVQLNTSFAAIGILLGFYHGITYFLAPFIAPFVNQMSVTLVSVVCAVGSLSLSIGFIASDVIQLSLVCVLSGFCYSLVRLAGVIRFCRNVRENFSVTYGIADAGNAIGMMVVPIVAQIFLENYGWNGSILLFGGLLLQNSIFLLLMKDLPRDEEYTFSGMSSSYLDSRAEEEDEDEVFDLFDEGDDLHDLIQRGRIVRQSYPITPCEAISRCCHGIYTYFGLSVFVECRHTAIIMFYMILNGIINASWLLFLIPHGSSRGYHLSEAVFLATCGGFGNVLGRVIQGPIIDRQWMSSVDLTLVFTVVNAVVFLLDPLILNFVLLAVAAFLGGLTIGARTTLTVVIAKEFFPADSFPVVYGLQSMFFSVGEPLGGLLAGFLAGRVNFSVSFMVLGGIEILTCLVLIPTRYFIVKNDRSEFTTGPLSR